MNLKTIFKNPNSIPSSIILKFNTFLTLSELYFYSNSHRLESQSSNSFYNKNQFEVITLNYAERMRNLRQDNDLSQKKVADMLGVAQTTYSQYELEKRPMPIDYLIALCKFYNVSADYMLGLSNRKNP